MATKLFAAARVGDAASAGNLIADILQASTEFSTTGRSLDGTPLLRNKGVRRSCVHDPSVPPKTGRVCFDPL
jgi:hypothetical protein